MTTKQPDRFSRDSEEREHTKAKKKGSETGILMGTIVGIVFFVVGVYWMRIGWRRRNALKKYEFEHRTSGGTVEFKDFEESKKHRGKMVRANSFYNIGLVMAVGSAFLLLVSFAL